MISKTTSSEDRKTQGTPEEKAKLRHLILRVAKDQAAFLYFQLEANEGLAFYSTLDQSLKESFRDIELFSPMSLEPELNHFLEAIHPQVNPLIILDEIIDDEESAAMKLSKGGKKSNKENG